MTKFMGGNMKIIVINGKGGAGKDTFVQCCNLMAAKKQKVYNLSMIDAVKDIAEEIGWEGGKTDKDRKFLSDLKDLVQNYNDYPFIVIQQELERIIKHESKYDHEVIIFIHARQPEDIDRLVNKYHAHTLLIRRGAVDEQHYGNHADDEVDNYKYDYTLENNEDIKQLARKAEYFMAALHEVNWSSYVEVKGAISDEELHRWSKLP